MAKRTKMLNKTLHQKLKIEKHETECDNLGEKLVFISLGNLCISRASM
jgi:hypothetical protein